MTNTLCLASIAAGSTILTLIGLYAGWRSTRVFLLRLDLLSIRNQLWDEARALNCLNDPVHRAYRKNLNLMVRYAHKIDLVALALSSREAGGQPPLHDSASPELRDALDRALTSTVDCMRNYILWHRPFTGVMLVWTLSAAAAVFRLASIFGRISFGVLKSSAAKIRSFAKTPDINTRQWFEHDGPTIFLGRGMA
jgi:hypothetical protein